MTNTELIRQEIERRCEEINSIAGDQYNEFQCGQMQAFGSLRAFIDSLRQEQTETDLEKEIDQWLEHGAITDTRYDDYDDDDIKATARHFYELGLNARKED